MGKVFQVDVSVIEDNLLFLNVQYFGNFLLAQFVPAAERRWNWLRTKRMMAPVTQKYFWVENLQALSILCDKHTILRTFVN